MRCPLRDEVLSLHEVGVESREAEGPNKMYGCCLQLQPQPSNSTIYF